MSPLFCIQYISFLLALLRVIFHLQIVPEHIDESSNYSEEMQQATAQIVQVFIMGVIINTCIYKGLYLRGVGDAGTRLLFKFRSGTHGLNEELGRHRGREGRKECLLCDAECESVSHVLWDCPAYVSIRSAFMLEYRFKHFQSLDSFEKSSYVLGSEAWEEYSSGFFVLSVWEERKVRLYGEHANVHSQNDSGDLMGVAGGDGELGCLCGKAGTSHLCDGSAHSSGCVVNGSNAMAAV